MTMLSPAAQLTHPLLKYTHMHTPVSRSTAGKSDSSPTCSHRQQQRDQSPSLSAPKRHCTRQRRRSSSLCAAASCQSFRSNSLRSNAPLPFVPLPWASPTSFLRTSGGTGSLCHFCRGGSGREDSHRSIPKPMTPGPISPPSRPRRRLCVWQRSQSSRCLSSDGMWRNQAARAAAAGLRLGMVRGQMRRDWGEGRRLRVEALSRPQLTDRTPKRADGKQGKGLFSLSSPFSSPLPAWTPGEKARCRNTWSEHHDFLQPLRPYVRKIDGQTEGWEKGQDLEGSDERRWAHGPGRSAPRTAPRREIPGPQLQQPQRAQPPQCTALPAATAAAGGGDRILLSSSLIPVPAQRTLLLREQNYRFHGRRKDGRGREKKVIARLPGRGTTNCF